MATLGSIQKWADKKAEYSTDTWLEWDDPFWREEMEQLVRHCRWRLNRWMRQARVYAIANRVPRDPTSQAWATYRYVSP